MRPRALHGPARRSITRLVSTRPFRFRLERVRSVRQHAEDLAAQGLAEALERSSASARELHSADERVLEARRASREGQGTPRSGADLLAAQSWLECAEHAREAAARIVARDEHEVERRRTALVEAVGKRKALDILETRQREEFERDAERAEVHALDEIALAGKRRRPVAA